MQTLSKNVILLALSFFIVSITWSQSETDEFAIEVARASFEAKTVAPPSPEAAELGKYGNTPVSLFTGTPQISIPLYELKGNSLSLPLNLSYNASGYMPSTVAPWTGIGWSLNGGGVITRSVAGNPDNSSNYYGQSPFTVPPSTDFFAYSDYKKQVNEATKEVKPDNFYFNFNGTSGKFFVTPAQIVVKKEKDNLKMETCLTCTVTYFNITDEQGNLYEFKETETTVMIKDDATATNPVSYVFPSAWYLSKITSADGKEIIEFEYYSTTGEEDMYTNFMQNTSVIYKRRTDASPSDPTSVSLHNANPPVVSIKRKYLKKISYKKNGVLVSYVDLVSAAGLRQDVGFTEARLLQQVKVFSNLSSPARLVKQFDLTYGYFSKTTTPTAKHLRLDKVQEMPVDGSGLVKPGYEMEYNTTTIPNRTTLALDYWGFYNQANNTSLVPTVTIAPNTYGYGADREPSLNGSACTLLKKIKYPTRGYTTFDYELNKDENNLAIGGVRIKEIIDYSFDNKKAVSKKYEYTLDNGNSSGKSNRHLLRFDNSSNYTHIAINGADETYTVYIVNISANSIYGLGSIKGSHIGYSQVTEYSADVTNNEPLGKTVYNYETRPFSENDDDIGNGDLKQKRVFNNVGKLLYELTNTYVYSVPETMPLYLLEPEDQQKNWPGFCKKTVGGIVTYEQRPLTNFMTDCEDVRYYYTLYDLRTDYVRGQYRQLTEQFEKKYDQASASYQSNNKKFTYGNTAHTYPTITEQSSSSNDVVVTTKKYAGDYTISGTPDANTSGVALLKNKNINGAVIEMQQFRKKNDGSNKRYIGGSLTTYNATLPFPNKIFSLDIDQGITTLPESAVTSGVFSYDNRYNEAGSFSYNATTGNLESQSKTSDVVTSYVWDYSDTYPVASVINAAPAEIAYTSFESSGKGGWTFAGTIGNATSPDFTPTGNKYYSLGSGAITKTVATAKTYILSYWAYSNTAGFAVGGGTSTWQKGATVSNWTYHEHKITAAAAATITITGTGSIDEVRLHPDGALMTTYAYDHLVGTTAINPPTQNIQYNEYDGFNRLLNIRDNTRSIVKNFNYNYATTATAITDAPATMWYNQATEQTLAKQGCAAGTYPTSVTYKIPYGKYVSSISQVDANAKASEDLTANAQAYANANGQCYYKSVQKIKKVFKSNCTYEQGTGLLYTYTVAAGAYTSVISQADADAQAQADADANAQAAANTYGTCNCDTEDKKFINGVCETGVRQNMSTSQEPNGQWKCTYRYYFSNGTYKGPYYSYGSSPCGVSN